MFNPFQFGSEPIGIDIGSSGAKLLQLRRGRSGLEAVASSRVDMDVTPAEATSDAHFVKLADAIKSSVSGAGFTGDSCVLSIDDAWLKYRSIRQPRMSDDERDGAVRLEGGQRLGFTEEQPGVVGWTTAGEVRESDAIREEVIIVGAEEALLERLVFAVAKTGMRPMAVEPGFMAVARAMTQRLRRQSDQNTLNVIIDIGLRHTSVMLTRGREVVFFKPLVFGGERVTEQVCSRMGIERETVLDLRKRRMQCGVKESDVSEIDPRVDRAMFDASRPLMDELAQEIALCLRYYSVTFRGAKPEKIILVGGEANEPHLPELIERVTRTTTVVGDPMADVCIDRVIGYGHNRRSSWSPWATAAGLGLRQMESMSVFGFKRGPQLRRKINETTAKGGQTSKREAA